MAVTTSRATPWLKASCGSIARSWPDRLRSTIARVDGACSQLEDRLSASACCCTSSRSRCASQRSVARGDLLGALGEAAGVARTCGRQLAATAAGELTSCAGWIDAGCRPPGVRGRPPTVPSRPGSSRWLRPRPRADARPTASRSSGASKRSRRLDAWRADRARRATRRARRRPGRGNRVRSFCSTPSGSSSRSASTCRDGRLDNSYYDTAGVRGAARELPRHRHAASLARITGSSSDGR